MQTQSLNLANIVLYKILMGCARVCVLDLSVYPTLAVWAHGVDWWSKTRFEGDYKERDRACAPYHQSATKRVNDSAPAKLKNTRFEG